jgi:CRISPR/Cas system CMR subunit Cmr6 (Cas7 group RAMP superfamily)
MNAMPANGLHRIPLPIAQTLSSLADDVHRTYFFKYPPLPVRWGQQISRKKRRSIRLGSYNHHTTEIRIHPILDAPGIPAFFIQSVIYHEYLHHVLGPHHNRRFHQHERQFRYHRESQEWIRRNLFLLLGRKKEEMRRAKAAAVAKPETPQAVQAVLF